MNIISQLFGKILRLYPQKQRRSPRESVVYTISGLRKDPEDKRDYTLCKSDLLEDVPKPKSVCWASYCPPVKNQGRLSSCGSHAFVNAYETMYKMAHKEDLALSELFHYYYSRLLMGQEFVSQDSGIYLRSGAKALNKYGAPFETSWTYLYMYSLEPSWLAKFLAIGFRAQSYARVSSLKEIKVALLLGMPVVIGVPVYEYWAGNKDGKVRMPTAKDKSVGNHAVLVVGYNDRDNTLKVLNSWGIGWGTNGYCDLQYEYVSLMIDAWTIQPFFYYYMMRRIKYDIARFAAAGM